MNDSRQTILLCGICLSILSGVSSLYAEGTKQLMPSNSSSSCASYVQGNDGRGKEGSTLGRPSTDWIYVHIEDPSEETIYFGCTRRLPAGQSLYYQILAPDGSIHCSGIVPESASDPGYIADDRTAAYVGPIQIAGPASGGYEALECIPTVAGDYAVLFNLGHPNMPNHSNAKYYVHPFDFTVAKKSREASPSAVEGRVFSYKWHLNTNSGSNQACMKFYTWTPDSMVVEMDMNGMQPWGYSVSFNSHGVTNTGDIEGDRKSSSHISESVPEYKVFLNPPDPAAYPSGTPGRVNFIEINACTVDSSYCIEVETTKAGELNVYIDLNGTGRYEAGTEDVYFPYQTDTYGTICVPWDGIDGFGKQITPSTTGNVIVEFLAGVVHFPVYDPENHTEGFRCSVVRPTGYQPQMYFDNRETPVGTYNIDGCDSLCNTWSGNRGDRIMVNTWLNTKTSTDTDEFEVQAECPPFARNDTVCTKVNSPIQIPILDNDYDPDNSLDPYSVSIQEIEHEEGSASFDPETGLLTFFPATNDSSNVQFSYLLCDSTASREGALCAEAQILVSIHGECLAATVLTTNDFVLQAQQTDDQAILAWEPIPEAEQYAIERSLAGDDFEQIGLVPEKGQPQLRFTDPTISQLAVRQVMYRVKASLSSQEIKSSSVAHLIIDHIPLEMRASISRSETAVALRYSCSGTSTLKIFDLMGKLVHQQNFSPSPTPSSIELPTASWGKGIYLAKIYHSHSQKVIRFPIQ